MGLTQRLGLLADVFQPDSSLNVGIGGAANSSYKLTVTGATLTTGAATFSSTSGIGATIIADWNRSLTNDSQLYIKGATNGNKQLRIGYDTTGNVGYIQALTSGTSVDNLLLNPSGGNVGIGTSSPSELLHLYGANPYLLLQGSEASAKTLYIRESAGGMYFGEYGVATRMIISSTGNVGIGTSSPQNLLHIKAGSSGLASYDVRYKSIIENNGEAYYVVTVPDNSYAGLRILGTSTGTKGGFEYYMTDDNLLIFSAGYQRFFANGSERMRITSGGDVYIGNSTISTANTAIFLQKSGLITNVYAYSSGSINLIEFYKQTAGTIIGTISYNGTNTLYNATSDYRLKEDLKDYNAIEIIGKLKTYDFKWKDTNVRDYGMMAHELQEILPNYVTGEKDAIKEDGAIKPQGVDYSKIVPILIKSIQELSAKVTALENKS